MRPKFTVSVDASSATVRCASLQSLLLAWLSVVCKLPLLADAVVVTAGTRSVAVVLSGVAREGTAGGDEMEMFYCGFKW